MYWILPELVEKQLHTKIRFCLPTHLLPFPAWSEIQKPHWAIRLWRKNEAASPWLQTRSTARIWKIRIHLTDITKSSRLLIMCIRCRTRCDVVHVIAYDIVHNIVYKIVFDIYDIIHEIVYYSLPDVWYLKLGRDVCANGFHATRTATQSIQFLTASGVRPRRKLQHWQIQDPTVGLGAGCSKRTCGCGATEGPFFFNSL